MKQARSIILALSLLIGIGLCARIAASSDGNPAGIPADSIGLVHQDVVAVPVPDEVHDNRTEPGERPVPPRFSPVAPPVIPHGIADFPRITRSANACVECHAVEEKVEGEPTPLPESHYRDLRNAPDSIRAEIAGSRYVCTSCHVPQTDARPLPVGGR
jgi:cytochrome c-type protein NapB